LDNKPRYVGLFGKVDGANFANINVDYKNGGINASNEYVGGFAGYIDGFVDGISIKNIKYINNNADITLDSGYMTYYGTGGFAGDANGMFRNIYLDNIQNITVRANLTDNSKIPEEGYDYRTMLNYGVGGFAGTTFGIFENIHIKNSGNLELNYKTNPGNRYPTYGIGVGGFTGNATGGIYNGILLQNIKTIKANHLNTPNIGIFQTFAGGFAGRTSSGSYKNISINEIGKIESVSNRTNSTGGFVGWIDGGNYNAIFVNDIREINSISDDKIASYDLHTTGGFAGAINTGVFCNIKIDKIRDLHTTVWGRYSYAGGFAGIIGSTWNSNIAEPYLKDIAIDNINSIKTSTKYDFSSTQSGGFAGYINSGKFYNISVKNIDEVIAEGLRGTIVAGGFAGSVLKGGFSDILIHDIKEIGASLAGNYNTFMVGAGGFTGSIQSGEFDKISIKGIAKITSKEYAGGFAGDIKGGKFSNISINNIVDIISSAERDSYSYAYAGGFTGSISSYISPEFSSITLNNIDNIIATSVGNYGGSYVGGFAGDINSGKFSNISLNHIQNIKSSYTPLEDESKEDIKKVYAGGFAGQISSGILENISIYDIKNIHAINNAQHHGIVLKSGSYAGGFAGDMYTTSKFNNIYMYFTPNSIIKSESKLNESYAGKFAGVTTMSGDGNLDISNIHIYHHKKDLTNATADQKYWGNEIQLHPYDDNSQGYIDFKTAALVALNGLKEIDCGTGKKCLVFTSDFKVDNPNITSPDIPDFNAKQPEPSIPNIEDIINEQA
ncbi:hypothetical protein CAMP5060_07985, partial [Campylobacter sp. 1569]|nr:hypothetical protein [Campylobacter sp. 1569]